MWNTRCHCQDYPVAQQNFVTCFCYGLATMSLNVKYLKASSVAKDLADSAKLKVQSHNQSLVNYRLYVGLFEVQGVLASILSQVLTCWHL